MTREEMFKQATLEDIYNLLNWHSEPSDPASMKRYKFYHEILFPRLLETPPLKKLLEEVKPRIRILDTLSASGIAGIALADVIAGKGYNIGLTLLDARREALENHRGWLEQAHNKDKIRIETIVGDATRLPKLLPRENPYHIVLLWGNSLPHFNAWSLHLYYSGVKEILAENGCLLIETTNLLTRLLVRNEFRHFLVEGGMISFYYGSDTLKGTYQRLMVRLPDMTLLGLFESRLHDIAGPSSSMLPYFEEIHVYRHSLVPMGSQVGSYTLMACRPRRDPPRWEDLVGSVPDRVEEV